MSTFFNLNHNNCEGNSSNRLRSNLLEMYICTYSIGHHSTLSDDVTMGCPSAHSHFSTPAVFPNWLRAAFFTRGKSLQPCQQLHLSTVVFEVKSSGQNSNILTMTLFACWCSAHSISYRGSRCQLKHLCVPVSSLSANFKASAAKEPNFLCNVQFPFDVGKFSSSIFPSTLMHLIVLQD